MNSNANFCFAGSSAAPVKELVASRGVTTQRLRTAASRLPHMMPPIYLISKRVTMITRAHPP